MTDKPLACVILGAGQGTRMKSVKPKVMHPIAGRPLISWLLETVNSLYPEKIIVVTGPDMAELEDTVKPHITVVQEDRLGTGDAVKTALSALNDFEGDVLILMGDMPMITKETMEGLIRTRYKNAVTRISVLGAHFDTPPAFGRMVLSQHDALKKIIEDKDCTDNERKITLCNMGAFCVDAERLGDWVKRIDNNNAQDEYYITDLPEIAAKDGAETHVFVTRNKEEIHGVNTRADLAYLETRAQNILRHKAMGNGATLLVPDSVYFSWDTILGKDVTIEPHVFFGPNVSVGDHAKIFSFSRLEHAEIKPHAEIGPFARIRGDSVIHENAKVGTFVEVNKTSFGRGSKAMHQSYIGMTDLGENCNIGAGVITCNYDGFIKSRTVIENNVFVGSNSNLVAPVSLKEGAFIAAGSTITVDVPSDALAVARKKPSIIEGWAATNREKKSALKKKAS